MNRLLDYARLLRLPNVFTAMADVLAASLLAHGPRLFQEPGEPLRDFGLLLGASSFLYLAGMALNDAFDAPRDRNERPERPIPAGQISRPAAFRVGFAMLALGAAIPWWVGQTSGMIAAMLAAAVLVYDAGAKSTQAGAVVMGFCRMCNFLLGLSAVPGAIWLPSPHGWQQPFVERLGTLAALGLGLYVFNLTRFARREATGGIRLELASSMIGINLGLILVGFLAVCPGLPATFELRPTYPHWVIETVDRLAPRRVSQIVRDGPLWAFTAIVVNAAVLRAVWRPSPRVMQQTVKTLIMCIILLDAAIVWMLLGPAWSALVLALLVPALTLGRFIYST